MFTSIAKNDKKIITESRTYIFSKVEESTGRLDVEYKSYNHKNGTVNQASKTKAYFLGDLNEISFELPQLLEAVFLNKRKYNGILIYAKTKSGKSNE